MGLSVDVRRYRLDNIVNNLIKASEIKKGWFKTTDKYWKYLEEVTNPLAVELDAHIFSDLFVYLQDGCKWREALHKQSIEISKNRNAFVALLVPQDNDSLLQLIRQPSFDTSFKYFVTELNGAYHEYTEIEVQQTIEKFISILGVMDEDNGLLINIG